MIATINLNDSDLEDKEFMKELITFKEIMENFRGNSERMSDLLERLENSIGFYL